MRLITFIFLFVSQALFSCGYADAYKNAIASAHPLATEAGMQVLRDGGNAFDAAVTVAAVLAVVEPFSSGIGGGGFWLLHRASDNKQVMLDGRERAPLASHRDMYLDEDGDVVHGLSMNGPLSAGIPGQVAAMTHLQRNYGSLPLARLLRPAIELADAGFKVDRVYQRLAAFRLLLLQKYPASAEVFLHSNEAPKTGSVIRQPDLANTLRLIARHGKDGFYAGQLAERLVQGVRQAGGIWSMQDLQRYRVIERQPLRFHWQGMAVTTAALPSSGGVVLTQIFNMLDQSIWSELDIAQRTHLLIEAMRRAYRERAQYLGDSDYVTVDTERLTSMAHAKRLIRDLDMKEATSSDSLPEVTVKATEGNDTTHYSILDKAGNRVAATLSINYPFGSGFVVPGTGVLLNDEMDDFSVLPGEANAYGLVGNEANAIMPGKRMLSSMSPSFIEDNKRMAIIGTPGGSRIITMVLLAMLAFHDGASAQQMAAAPRLHHQYLPDRVQLEPGALSDEVRQQLHGMGHELQELNDSYGNMQVILHDYVSSITQAASDPRGIGAASVE
ncbi:MAG: gamma-glutamyltransferase [Gammaproteobacteria bacterium]|nr:gamma-glutamyltransferase [Gammaproteobacteria bacterium]